MPVGFRIGASRPRVSPEFVEKYRELPVANVSDSMMRMGAGSARIRPYGPSALVGPALVVRTRPGDNLMVHKAIMMAEPGDVIVVDAGGDLTNSIMGERMVATAESRGIAGIIVNGAIRDVNAIANGKLPVFAAGVTHRGPYKDGPGEINYPIGIDGTVIQSGDLIVADDDGWHCVPIDDVQAVYDKAYAVFDKERTTDASTEKRPWIDEFLQRLGCEMPA